MKLIYIFIITFLSNLSFAHKDIVVKKTYGNVLVFSSTFYKTEDISKNLIIGNYLEMLSKKKGFKQQINLFLIQDGITKFSAYYNTNKQNGSMIGLNILIRSSEKDVLKVLTLAEFIIDEYQNLDNSEKNLEDWYNKETSEEVKDIVNTPIYRLKDIKELNDLFLFDYYYQNDRFHLTTIKSHCDSIKVGGFEKILQINEPFNYSICIFTSLNTVVYIETKCKDDYKSKTYFIDYKSTNLTINT